MPTVVGVRKESSADGTHQHIAGVCTDIRLYCPRAEVVAGIDRGEAWSTKGPDGSQATIKKLRFCPAPACMVTPYITTAPDHTTRNNLDNLPAC